MNILSDKAVKYIYSNWVELNQAWAIGVASVILEDYLDDCEEIGYEWSARDFAKRLATKYEQCPHDEFHPWGYNAMEHLQENHDQDNIPVDTPVKEEQ